MGAKSLLWGWVILLSSCVANVEPETYDSQAISAHVWKERREIMRRHLGGMFSGHVTRAIVNPEPNESTQGALTRFRQGLPVYVVVVGNSIGCGYNATNWANITQDANARLAEVDREAPASHINGWVQRLRDYVVSVNASSRVYNLSGNGWDTHDHLETQNSGAEGYTAGRSGTFTIIDAMAQKPDLVILPLQVNDRTYSVESTFVVNTTAIVTSLRNRDIAPVIMMENRADSADTVIARAGTLALALNVALIDANTSNAWSSHLIGSPEPWYEGDNTHPNDTGHTQLYNTVKSWFDTAGRQP